MSTQGGLGFWKRESCFPHRGYCCEACGRDVHKQDVHKGNTISPDGKEATLVVCDRQPCINAWNRYDRTEERGRRQISPIKTGAILPLVRVKPRSGDGLPPIVA